MRVTLVAMAMAMAMAMGLAACGGPRAASEDDRLAALADEMCACQTAACVSTVHERLFAGSAEGSGSSGEYPAIDSASPARVANLRRYFGCFVRRTDPALPTCVKLADELDRFGRYCPADMPVEIEKRVLRFHYSLRDLIAPPVPTNWHNTLDYGCGKLVPQIAELTDICRAGAHR